MKKNVFLIISVVLLLLSLGLCGYLFYQNKKLEDDIAANKESIKKVEETIKKGEQEITEKESEYEKLKEKVKDNLEELGIWEGLKEELNKSLS
jgi:peptidoglycan hydrolase CwlO-like protein